MTTVNPKNLPCHPTMIGNYLVETGEWRKVRIREPIRIDGRFVVDEDVERRLRTWVQTQDAWGPCPQRLWTDFEYRRAGSAVAPKGA